MTIESGISLVDIILLIIGLSFGLVCFKRYRNCMILLAEQNRQLADFELALIESRETLETATGKFVDNNRRIAWLETRIRQPKINEPETLHEIVHSNSQPVLQTTNITERRHRVLSLAARGQDSEFIAATLGMMRGEVELILNLHKTV